MTYQYGINFHSNKEDLFRYLSSVTFSFERYITQFDHFLNRNFLIKNHEVSFFFLFLFWIQVLQEISDL